jgi:hypothetical protein
VSSLHPGTTGRKASRRPPKPVDHQPGPVLDLRSDQVVSPKVTAQILNVSLGTLRRLWRKGTGPRRIRLSARRYGAKLRDIAAYLDRA